MKHIRTVIVGIALFAWTLPVAYAQDEVEENADALTPLSQISGNPDEFYGQTVTVEGTIADLLNAQTFELTGEGLFGGGRALVMNETNSTFDPDLTDGRNVRVTGEVTRMVRVEREPQQNNGEVEDTETATNDDAAMTPSPEGEAMDDATETPETDSLGEPNVSPVESPALRVDGERSAAQAELFDAFPLQTYDDITVISIASVDEIIFIETLGNIANNPERYRGRRLIVRGNVEDITPEGIVLGGGGPFGGGQVFVFTSQPFSEGEAVDVLGTVETAIVTPEDNPNEPTEVVSIRAEEISLQQ